jgi:hypothetical protein
MPFIWLPEAQTAPSSNAMRAPKRARISVTALSPWAVPAESPPTDMGPPTAAPAHSQKAAFDQSPSGMIFEGVLYF